MFHISRNWKTVQNECVTWKHKYQHLNHQKQQLQSSEQISLQSKRRVESSLQQMSKSLVQEQIKSDTKGCTEAGKHDLKKLRTQIEQQIIL